MFAFFLGQVCFQTESRVKKCIQIIFTTGIIVALIGILQLITDLHYNPKIMRLFGVEIHRLSSTIGNPNTLGFFLTMNILIAINYLFGKTKRYRRTFLLFTIVIMSICLFFTYSRMAFIALFVGIIVMAAIRGKTKMLYFSVIAFIPAIIFMPSLVVYRYRGIFYGLDAGRSFMWQAAWDGFLQNPIFGVGYGKIGGVYAIGKGTPLAEFMARSIDHMPVVDSSYFFILNETGIIGFGLFCLLLIFIFKKGWSLMKELESLYLRQLSVCLFSILIALSTAAVTANIFGMVFPMNFYFWFLSGILVNLKNIDSNFVQ
jgi:O-antigen ligase